MRICILNSETKVCENVIDVDQESSFVPYKQGIEVAPDHTGEIGWVWESNKWVDPNAPQLDDNILAQKARHKRNNLLKQSVDRINPLRWETYTEQEKAQWTTYRKALLDIPEQSGFPRNIVWPLSPVSLMPTNQKDGQEN